MGVMLLTGYIDTKVNAYVVTTAENLFVVEFDR